MAAPKNARKARSGRFYVWGRGERYWSVTTILSVLKNADALKWWAAGSVAEFAVDRTDTWLTMKRDEAIDWLKREPLRFSTDRADFGSAIHAAAEAYAIGKPITYRREWGDEERAAIGYLLRHLKAFEVRFGMTEASVFSRTEKYAGTLDAIVDYPYRLLVERAGGPVPWEPRPGNDHVRLLVDYKTGGSVEEGKGVYSEVALQLSAYGRAEFIGAPNGTEVPMPDDLDGAAVLHVNAGGARLVPVDALREEVFRSFLYVREVFRWQETLAKEVLGHELAVELPTHPTSEEPAP